MWSVTGWAVCAVGISAIIVYLDDKEMGKPELGLPREDVGEVYHHIPMARFSGFRFGKALGNVPDGEHQFAWCCAMGSTMCEPQSAAC